jgi:hypothetical protein
MNKQKEKKDVSQQGQSVVEYLILVGVIISLLVLLLSPGGFFALSFERTILQQGDDAIDASRELFPTR